MENTSITIVSEFKKGKISIKDAPVPVEWKTYLTDQQNIIFLRAFMQSEIKEVTYDASAESFAEALNRVLQSK